MDLFTPQLVLREFRENDYEAFRLYFADPQVRRYERDQVEDGEIQNRFNQILHWIHEQPRTHYVLAVTVPPQEYLVGTLSLSLNNASIQEWEIGWGIRPEDWGKGYAPEAAQEMMHFAFETLNARRIVAFCHYENFPSVRVMQKLGMQREGRLREVRWLNAEWCDEYVYALLRREVI